MFAETQINMLLWIMDIYLTKNMLHLEVNKVLDGKN